MAIVRGCSLKKVTFFIFSLFRRVRLNKQYEQESTFYRPNAVFMCTFSSKSFILRIIQLFSPHVKSRIFKSTVAVNKVGWMPHNLCLGGLDKKKSVSDFVIFFFHGVDCQVGLGIMMRLSLFIFFSSHGRKIVLLFRSFKYRFPCDVMIFRLK